MWWKESIYYQIYPLGLCNAPKENDGVLAHRILNLLDWTDYIKALGVDAVLFNPLFESDRHGYDSRDFTKVDCRLGTQDDLKKVTDALHRNNLKILFDGVFNHVGRGFWAFKDVQAQRENSPYRHWFNIDFNGNSNYNDGFWYEGWEGHYELVKLNLSNPDVVSTIFDSIRLWVDAFDIDGLRLDVAYCLDKNFLHNLRLFCNQLKSNFVLIGETLHGDYNQFVNEEMLHSCTNYECYKGLYSSMNDCNLFEISHSLNRQFGPEHWTIYKNKHLLCFLDNHDVSRIFSILKNKAHFLPATSLLFTMPGMPSLYYGSEWGMPGLKQDGDDCLRPALHAPIPNENTKAVIKMIAARKKSKALVYGTYRNIIVGNTHLIFERQFESEILLAALNIDDKPVTLYDDAFNGNFVELINEETVNLNGAIKLAAYEYKWLKKV